MSYEPGKMGIAEGTALVFLTTFTSVFLSIWSVVIGYAATTAWLIPLIGTICFIAMFAMLLFVMERVPGDLYEVSERLLGKTGARLIMLYFITAFFSDTVLLLRQFAENTLLTAIPDLDICLVTDWYALMAAIAVYTGIEPLARASFVILPFGIVGAFIIMLLLYNNFNIYNLSPWIGTSLPVICKTGVLSSSVYLNTFLLFILAPSFHNLRTIKAAALFGVGMSTLFRVISFFMYTGVFSVAVGREKVLPFFEMVRLIHLNRFIQRVETFFILLWVIFGIATIAINLYVVLYLLTRFCNLPSMRPLILPLVIIAAQLAILPSDIATTIELTTKVNGFFLTFGLFAVPLILLTAAFIQGKGKSKSCTIK